MRYVFWIVWTIFLLGLGGCHKNLCPENLDPMTLGYYCYKLPGNIPITVSMQEFCEIDNWVKKNKNWKLSLDSYVYDGIVVGTDSYDLLINKNYVVLNYNQFPFQQYVCMPDEVILAIVSKLEKSK